VTRAFDRTSGDRVPASLLNRVMVTAPNSGLRSSGKGLPASSLARVPAQVALAAADAVAHRHVAGGDPVVAPQEVGT